MLIWTVYRDGSWWVGGLEWDEADLLYAARHIFASEPSNEAILAFVLNDWLHLFDHRLVGVQRDQTVAHVDNPKRRLREITRHAEQRGISPQNQEALDRSRALYKQEQRNKRR